MSRLRAIEQIHVTGSDPPSNVLRARIASRNAIAVMSSASSASPPVRAWTKPYTRGSEPSYHAPKARSSEQRAAKDVALWVASDPAAWGSTSTVAHVTPPQRGGYQYLDDPRGRILRSVSNEARATATACIVPGLKRRARGRRGDCRRVPPIAAPRRRP